MNGDRPAQSDAIISIESTAEWQVHDILYDGQERYVAPLTFSDYVAKYARKVDWRKLVGSETSADDYSDEEAEEETTEAAARQRTTPASSDNELHKLLARTSDDRADADKLREKPGLDYGEEADEWPASGSRSSPREPETDGGETSQRGVGPWDSVAKRLFQSLTEMNVLLDAVQVARNGKYLLLDPVQQDPSEQPKNAVLAAKKKALTSASAVLLSLADQMRPKSAAASTSAQQLDPDLEELMEMRRHWRLKKVGNTIVGDLSYYSVGKYRPNATFEVRKAEKMEGAAVNYGVGGGSPGASKTSIASKSRTWRVVLPKDLEEALHLRVAVETADGGRCGAVDYFGGKPYPKMSSDAGWREKLQLAQRTLFCRDLFAQLAREAAHVTDLCCAVRGGSIVVRLAYGHSLRIALDPYASETGENERTWQSTNDGAFVLEHNLRQLFDAELDGANRVIIPRPVAAPLTHLSKKSRSAGPDALSTSVLSSESDADKLLIQRLAEQTQHFLFYQRSKKVMDEFAAACRDPAVSVHWCPETTGVWSMVRMQMMTPYYDCCGKELLILEIGVDSIKATLRDGEVVTLSSNLGELEHFLKLRARQHIVSAVGTLCRPHQWQTLYSNPCQVDENGQLAPAILVGHPAGTSAIHVRYPLVSEPLILVQTSSDSAARFAGDVLSSNGDKRRLWSRLRSAIRPVNYEQLPGNNFLHKIELLIATVT